MPPPPVVGAAPEELPALLARFPILSPPVPTAGAAVVIVLRNGEHEVEMLLIERASNPEDPASGQVALPGGHVNEVDDNLLATALRELEEEVGLSAEDLDGSPRYVGTQYTRAFDLHVGIFAAALGPAAPHAPHAHNAKEVAQVFWLPRSALGTTRRVQRDTVGGPAEVNATVEHGEILWGFTRRVLRSFFGLTTEDQPDGPAFGREGG